MFTLFAAAALSAVISSSACQSLTGLKLERGAVVAADSMAAAGKLERPLYAGWRETAKAPQSIPASNPQTGLSHPLCAYPQTAQYSGSGNIKGASNWSCKAL